jgi:alkanesulfonate monooxygenase SsuD/methylene tetrahydromethanopterin reductase-like flavin-dependent oxidoreductase (luciferase family)
VKIDASLRDDIETTKREAGELEAAGYDGIWVGESW